MRKLLQLVLVNGARLSFKNVKFLFLLWSTNFGFAFAITYPVYSLLSADLTHSLMNSHFTGEFDFLWFTQFMTQNEKTIAGIPGLLLSLTGIYNLIQLFYSGGFISVLLNPGKNHWVDFFFGGVKYFSRFFKLFLWTILLYVLAVLVNTATYTGMQIVLNSSDSPYWVLGMNLLRNSFFLFFICSVNLLVDYTKIMYVSHDEAKLRNAFSRAIRFIRENFRVALIVYLFCALLVGVAAVGYNILDSYIPKTSLALIIVTFFIQQVLVIFRFLIKILFFSTEVVLYSEVSADVISADAEEVVAGA
jgi:hypothetical protein